MLTSSASKIFLISWNILLSMFHTLVNVNIQQTFLSLKTYLYACVFGCMKYVVYIFTVKLFKFTNTKFFILACNWYEKFDVCVSLKLDKPVFDICLSSYLTS